MTDDEQLQRTVRCLELMGDSYRAFKNGDVHLCDSLLDQAVEEAGGDTFVLIRGGMTIGEIPKPENDAFWPYLYDLQARLPQTTDKKEV
jgi:hypothetical protein